MSGAFIAVGPYPVGIVLGIVETDENGYVLTEGKSTRTNVPGFLPPVTLWTTPTGRRSPPPEQAMAALDAVVPA